MAHDRLRAAALVFLIASLTATQPRAQEPGSRAKQGARLPLDLVLTVDVSGSMTGRKIEIVRQAIKRVTRRLHKRDRFGLVAFSTQARILHPLGAASDREMIDSSIGKLEPGGGTNILAALERSALIFEHGRGEGRRRSHLVLISDGQSAYKGLSEQVQKMRQRGITISCLGVGESADDRLLRTISKAGGGRFYGAGRLKQIFSRLRSEARKIGR